MQECSCILHDIYIVNLEHENKQIKRKFKINDICNLQKERWVIHNFHPNLIIAP